MRKGEARRDWTTAEVGYLLDAAGRVPRREICRHLRRSRKSVERKAACLGLSLRCYVRRLRWCPACATWRSTVRDETGQCRVCEKREQLERSEDRVSAALARLGIEQRAAYEAWESKRSSAVPPKPLKPESCPVSRYERAKAEDRHLRDVERWEVACLDRRINANKTRLRRIREKTGDNPRKKSKSMGVCNENPDQEVKK